MAHHVIYVPGLGDKRSYGQDIVLNLWSLFGLKPHYFPLGWADQESVEPKLTRLLDKIDSLKKDGDYVSIVGVSAGASAVLNTYAVRKEELTGVICICGKINNPQKVGDKIYELNPAFKQSMARVQDSLKTLDKSDRARIMSIHPLVDMTVPITDTKIPGSIEKTVPVAGHILGIFYSVIFGSPAIIQFLKRQAKN